MNKDLANIEKVNKNLFKEYGLEDDNFNKLIVYEKNISRKKEKENIKNFIKCFKRVLQEKLISNYHELMDNYLDKVKCKYPFTIVLSDFVKIDKTISYKFNVIDDVKTIKCNYCIGINWYNIMKYGPNFKNNYYWGEPNFYNTYSLYFLSNKDFDGFYLIDDNRNEIKDFVKDSSDNIFDIYHNNGEQFCDLCDKIIQYIVNSLA